MAKRKIFLIVIFLITLVCVIVGTALHLAGNGPFGGILRRGSTYAEEEQSLSGIEEISAELSVADLRIEEGAEGKILIASTERIKPELSIDGSTLSLKQKDVHQPWFGENERCNIVITVPRGTTIKSAELASDVGDIQMQSLSLGRVSLDTDVGDVELSEVSFESGRIASDVGDVKLIGTAFEQCEIETNVGDTDIETPAEMNLSEYTVDLQTSIGEVRYLGQKESHEFTKKGNPEKHLEITGDVGDIRVE